MRQMLAVSWVLLAYTYLDRRLNFRFLVIVIMAATIHTSALIAISLLWIRHFSFSKRKILWALCGTFILSFFLNDAVFTFLAGPYAGYIENNSFSRENLIMVYAQVVLMNLLFYLIYYTANSEFRNIIYMKIFLVAILLMNLTMRLGLGSRIIIYFMIIQSIFYPLYLDNNRVKNKRCVCCAILLYVVFVFLKLLIWDGNKVVPYQSIVG